MYNVTLRKLKIYDALSKETTCFTADIYVDGVRVGAAENEGHGGETMVSILRKDIRDRLEDFGRSQTPEQYRSFMPGVVWLIDGLVEAEAKKKDEAKMAKKIARIDAKEKEALGVRGFKTARYRAGDVWRWFGFKDGARPEDSAKAVAAKHKESVDEMVVVS